MNIIIQCSNEIRCKQSMNTFGTVYESYCRGNELSMHKCLADEYGRVFGGKGESWTPPSDWQQIH